MASRDPVDPEVLCGYIFGLSANMARFQDCSPAIVSTVSSAQLDTHFWLDPSAFDVFLAPSVCCEVPKVFFSRQYLFATRVYLVSKFLLGVGFVRNRDIHIAGHKCLLSEYF